MKCQAHTAACAPLNSTVRGQMRRHLVLLVGAITLGMSALAGEPYYVPQGLDASSITQRLLTDYAKPGYKLEDLAGARVKQTQALIFRARVDDTPLVVE